MPDEPSQTPDSLSGDPAAVDPLLGTTIDRYRIVQKIGEGGMGTVYSVEHVLLRKRMAMKLLRAEFGRNPELVHRFQNEAVAASSIGQDNIVSVTDFGWTQEGYVYLVMEELQGTSLAQAIHDEPGFQIPRALEIASQICKAFAAAHAAGIVHRDLKPDNVFLVRRTGQPEFVKVLDFGISKVTQLAGESESGDARLTKTGMILGTPEYMSPEQSAGRPVDLRTDVYSWGIVLFEMLAGRLPFQADNPIAMLMKHQTVPPATFDEVRPDLAIPATIERIVRKALAKRVQDRYQTMDEALADLQATPELQSLASASRPGTNPPVPAALPEGQVASAPFVAREGTPSPSPSPSRSPVDLTPPMAYRRPPAPVTPPGANPRASGTPSPSSTPSRFPPPPAGTAAPSRPPPERTPSSAEFPVELTPSGSRPIPGRPGGAVGVDRLQLLRSDLRKETLTPEEGFIASRLIGVMPTMEELLATSGLPRPQATAIINGLLAKGIIGRRAASVVRPPPGSAAEQNRDQERRDWTRENPLVSRFVRKQVLVQRGRESLARGHTQEALSHFRTAAALDGRDQDLIRLIEDTQGKVDQFEADRLFREGEEAEGRKDYSTALFNFRRAMELRPGNGRYIERVARKLLYKEESFNEAKKLVDRAVQLQPNDPDTRATLARAYLNAGLKGKAKRELELVLQLNKEHKFAKSMMKKLRWWSGSS